MSSYWYFKSRKGPNCKAARLRRLSIKSSEINRGVETEHWMHSVSQDEQRFDELRPVKSKPRGRATSIDGIENSWSGKSQTGTNFECFVSKIFKILIPNNSPRFQFSKIWKLIRLDISQEFLAVGQFQKKQKSEIYFFFSSFRKEQNNSKYYYWCVRKSFWSMTNIMKWGLSETKSQEKYHKSYDKKLTKAEALWIATYCTLCLKELIPVVAQFFKWKRGVKNMVDLG